MGVIVSGTGLGGAARDAAVEASLLLLRKGRIKAAAKREVDDARFGG